MTVAAAAATAEAFLVEYMSAHDFFSPVDEIEEPRIIPFSACATKGGAIEITFGLRPSDDCDDPSEQVTEIVAQCLAALAAAHPELSPFAVEVVYAN